MKKTRIRLSLFSLVLALVLFGLVVALQRLALRWQDAGAAR